MQFKAVVIALAAVGSAVATPIENAAQAPSAKQMMDQATAFAKEHVGQVPDADMIAAAEGLKAAHQGFPFFNHDPFPCLNFCPQPQPWGFWDYFNAYCFQQFPVQFPIWNNWCLNPNIQINTCRGLLGCLL